MTARAAAAVPFATAAGLLDELAGIRLPTKRIERAAEADGRDVLSPLVSGSSVVWPVAQRPQRCLDVQLVRAACRARGGDLSSSQIRGGFGEYGGRVSRV